MAPVTSKLAEAREPIRAALEQLAETPRELRCFVIIEETRITGRFVQFCTPPPPSHFKGSTRAPIIEGKPLIYDGTGLTNRNAYEPVQEHCDIEDAVIFAIDTLEKYLPPDAEITIISESTQLERPS